MIELAAFWGMIKGGDMKNSQPAMRVEYNITALNLKNNHPWG
jgi:hypothetical protein